MAGFFKRLFGQKPSPKAHRTETSSRRRHEHAKPHSAPPSVQFADPSLPDGTYFSELERLTAAVSAKEYHAAAAAARASLPFLRQWLEDPRGDGKRLDIRIPALSQGGTMMALIGDLDGLTELRDLVFEHEFLDAYRDEAEEHFVHRDLFNQIRDVIRDKPGVLQNGMKTELGIEDGRLASRLVSYLEKSGEVRRAKKGKTYALYLAGIEMPDAASDAIYVEPNRPGSHRKETRPARATELDPKRVRIVPLPPSPKAWEKPVELPKTEDAFADFQGSWTEIRVDSIRRDNRPDPAFRKHFSTRGGALSFDDLAKSETSLGRAGAVLFSNSKGQPGTPLPLLRHPYEISVHPLGDGFALRSRSNVLTVYDAELNVDFETDLSMAPEIPANRERLGLAESDTHRALRCIALSPERGRYLFTHVDEAWCIDRHGSCLWGLRMPAKEPTRVRVEGQRFGMVGDIQRALDVMGLKMPVTPDEVRRRYRQLVRELHPDLDPGNEERMKAVNVASEQLTGLEPGQLDGSDTGGGGFEIVISFGAAAQADWIYAAAFSGNGQTALLGSYSGRVVRVDRGGTPVEIYDVGSVPVRIVETDAFLYIMTATRLYVLQEDRLMALEDCASKCDLLVDGGLVLLVETKGVRVLTEDGRALGIALTKAPIRRAYVDEGDLVIETRTQRGRFHGLRSVH